MLFYSINAIIIIMRFIERAPLLPDGEGQLWHHSAAGEHATKFIGKEEACNVLASHCLKTLAGDNVPPYTGKEFFDLLISPEASVVVVEHIPEGGDRPDKVAGFGVVRFDIDYANKYTARGTIERLVVHPNFRNRRIASFILGKTIMNDQPTELVLDTTKFETDPGFIETLQKVGFRHQTEGGSPAMWLPGAVAGAINYDEVDMETILAKMPPAWSGIIPVYGNAPDSDARTEVYRQGKRIGILRTASDSVDFDWEVEWAVTDFSLSDGEDNYLDTVTRVARPEALISLMNMHDLVPSSSGRTL